MASTQQLDEDARAEIEIGEDFDDDVYNGYELYGILNTKVVGVRYYNGRSGTGEYTKVRREPSNPYDSNAIRIDNVMNHQIGHIGRNVAAKLARLMDTQQLLVEGAITGAKGAFDVPIALKMFGTTQPGPAAALKQQMQGLGLPVTDFIRAERERKQREKELEKQRIARGKEIERQRQAREKALAAAARAGSITVDEMNQQSRYASHGMPGSQSEIVPGMDQLLTGTATFNPRDVQDVVKQFGQGEAALSSMPMADQPDVLSTVLLPYQRQGLQWLLDHESPKLPTNSKEDAVQLWKASQGVYTNIATNFSVSKAPELASGGILADDMGLGKTIQVISLIMSDPHKSRQPTLIIAPLSVMSNWSTQAAAHVKKKFAPRVFIYHGQENKGLTPAQLEEYDIVITTYQTMTHELFPYKKEVRKVPSSKGLFSITWRRVVLDEGHQIRNPKAKMSIAASSLMAKSRWVLTGTPIINSLKDLYSHVKFLGLPGGLANFEVFNSTIIRPLKSGDPNAQLLLRALMSTICLRRMKDMKFIDLKLQELTFHQVAISFLKHEQERYDAFLAEAKGALEDVKMKKAKGNGAMTHLLEVLLRMRQVTNHWRLVGESRIKDLLELVEENKVVDVLNEKNRRALQDLLQLRIDSQEDCPVCMDTMRSPVITACAHAFCTECIEKVIETQHKCPMCRAELVNNETLVPPSAGIGEGDEEDAEPAVDAEATSSKIEALIQILKASEAEGNTKTVVFSQWTSFLDIVQTQLLQHGLNFTRLDGKMTAIRRDAAIESISTDPSCKIMLASLAVCSVGLNLVAANNVVLCDSWWAPAIEDQAVDRVHRLGQTRDCKVLRLVVEGTVEEEVLAIQAEKRKLAATAFGEKESGKKRGAQQGQTLQQIQRLLRAH